MGLRAPALGLTQFSNRTTLIFPMRIFVTRFKGAPLAETIQAEFSASGGTIGREPGNLLILPDPERHISRTHARVVVEGDVFLLEDLGGNPTFVNGRPVGRGNRVPLADGDSITVGHYDLRTEIIPKVSLSATPARPVASRDPLGLFGASGPDESFGMSAAVRGPVPQSVSPVGNGSALGGSDDPFGVFFSPATAKVPAPSAAPAPDPFINVPPSKPTAPSLLVFAEAPIAREAGIDDIFGIGSADRSDPFAGTPLSSHSAPCQGPPAAEDPLSLFGGAPSVKGAPAPVRDDVPFLAENFTLPKPQVPQAGPPEDIPVTLEAPVVGHRPLPLQSEPAPGIVLSWADAPRPPGRPVPVSEIKPAPRPVDTSPGQVSVTLEEVPSPAHQTGSAILPATADTAARAVVGEGELLEAFQRGLGIPVFTLGGLTPERMEQLGKVVRESVSGTMSLLKARAMTKREIRAEMTMIVSRENNPLKFAPDLPFALAQLLEPQGRGFLEAVPAMQDAYLDLRSHQFGFLAGMRAAIGGLLQRFKPEVLETRISAGGLLANVLPGARKARLWDLYEQHYADISREAADDFDALFGREFLKAYEEQIDRLSAEAENV